MKETADREKVVTMERHREALDQLEELRWQCYGIAERLEKLVEEVIENADEAI